MDMQGKDKNLIIGIILIVIGAVWALDNIEIIPWQFRYYLFNWENVLIGLGAFLLFSQKNLRVGAILFALGVFFSLDDWFNYNLSIWELWPLLFVFAGIYLLGRNQKPSDHISSSDDDNTIADTTIFGGGDRVMASTDFRGGSLTAIFGGSNIDLTTAKMQTSPAMIDVFFMFGGSKIRVPQEWVVEFQVTNLFGGLADKRTISQNPAQEKKLIIKGLIIFGGSEIVN